MMVVVVVGGVAVSVEALSSLPTSHKLPALTIKY